MIEHVFAKVGNCVDASFRLVVAVLAAALTMTACASDDGSSAGDGASPGGEATASGDERETSVLKNLSGDQLCGLLSDTAIEQHLGATVKGSESQERGRAPEMQSPYFLTRQCEYDTGDVPNLSTDVTTKWDESTSDEAVLEEVFTDSTGDSDSTGDYERVQGLGDVAGFGGDAMLSQADVAGRDLGVVFHIGGERLLLTVSSLGQAELAQLRPLAEELLSGLEDAVQ